MRPDAPFSPEEVLQEVMTAPWLILDDLGAAPLGEWDRGQMDGIIDARWAGAKGKLRTLITTNLVGDQMPKRMTSRLKDAKYGKILVIRAADFRVTQS
jgi:DNA replication protein DnaC